MEFYDDFTQIDLDSLEFQFPTGWNSTKPEHQRSRKLCEVSIPNGMEFYQFTRIKRVDRYNVSIPNGMEFYQLSLVQA